MKLKLEKCNLNAIVAIFIISISYYEVRNWVNGLISDMEWSNFHVDFFSKENWLFPGCAISMSTVKLVLFDAKL